jgi:putative transposase
MVPPRGKTFVSVHASIHNHVDQDCHLNRRNIFKEDRSTALAEWHQMFG